MQIDILIWSSILIVFILSSYFVGGTASKNIALLERAIIVLGAGFIFLYYSSFIETLIYAVLYVLTFIVVSKMRKRPLLRRKE